MIILAHRCNLDGSTRQTENTLAACETALQEGFGLETDLRRDGEGCFYISHDASPVSPQNRLDAFARLFRRFADRVVAMNVKELGYEEQLVQLAREGTFGERLFYFDFELIEPATPGTAQRKVRTLSGGTTIRMAARLSDRGESLEQCLSIPADVVWADEFDSLWLTEVDVRRVHQAGREFYAISPELHGFSRDKRLKRWAQFAEWGVHGICTDFALEARKFFEA